MNNEYNEAINRFAAAMISKINDEAKTKEERLRFGAIVRDVRFELINRNVGTPKSVIHLTYNNTVEKQKNDDDLMRKE